MTKVNATCRICGNRIPTNTTNHDYDISNHFIMAHPLEYKEASVLKTRIEELKREFYDITGCRDIRMFPERK